jgi:hypothetical protein
VLLKKFVELNVCANEEEAFEKCFKAYRNLDEGSVHFNQMKEFLIHLTSNQ